MNYSKPTAVKREEIVKTYLFIVGTFFGSLGFIKILELREEQPEVGIPIILTLGASWLIAGLIGYRDKR
jgi:hypothetical protein